MLKAARRMRTLVFEVEVDARILGQLEADQVCICRAVEIRLDLTDGFGKPSATGRAVSRMIATMRAIRREFKLRRMCSAVHHASIEISFDTLRRLIRWLFFP